MPSRTSLFRQFLQFFSALSLSFAVGCGILAGPPVLPAPPPNGTTPTTALIEQIASELTSPNSTDSRIGEQLFLPAGRQQHASRLFQSHCAICHGSEGDGKGIAADLLETKPRDFRKGVFKFQSTYYGAKPLPSDIERTIRHGIPGTTMPPFKHMSSDTRAELSKYVTWIAFRGELMDKLDQAQLADEAITLSLGQEIANEIADSWNDATASQVINLQSRDRYNEESIARGKLAFVAKGCAKCHGPDGKGETEQNLKGGLRDAWNEPVRAADLTTGRLKGGRRPMDIYRRILGGINGTPMPSFRATLSSEPATIWDLVSYVQFLGGKKTPSSDQSDE